MLTLALTVRPLTSYLTLLGLHFPISWMSSVTNRASWKQSLEKKPTCKQFIWEIISESKRRETEEEEKPIEGSVWCRVGHCFGWLVLRTIQELHEMSSLRAVHQGDEKGKEAFIHQLSTSAIKGGPRGAKGPTFQVCTCMSVEQDPTCPLRAVREALLRTWEGWREAWNKVLSGYTEGKQLKSCTEVVTWGITSVRKARCIWNSGQRALRNLQLLYYLTLIFITTIYLVSLFTVLSNFCCTTDL